DPLYHLGQQISRFINPFANLSKTFKFEEKVKRYLAKHGLSWRELGEQDKRDHELYLQVLGLIEKSGEKWEGGNRAQGRNIIEMLTRGQTSAWIDDQRHLDAQIMEWLQHAPYKIDVSSGVDRDATQANSSKGFKHGSAMGVLLCPVTLDWSKQEVRGRLNETAQPLEVNEWPRLLYQNMEYNAQDPWDGFLRNRLLLK
ncbi:hypothetical protein BKA70DRAFT_1029050, partial [Coprinopsis sp. MPI-PUGE-AT-0042]